MIESDNEVDGDVPVYDSASLRYVNRRPSFAGELSILLSQKANLIGGNSFEGDQTFFDDFVVNGVISQFNGNLVFDMPERAIADQTGAISANFQEREGIGADGVSRVFHWDQSLGLGIYDLPNTAYGYWLFDSAVLTFTPVSPAPAAATLDLSPHSMKIGSFGIVNSNTPASAGASGVAGTICWDANFLYVAVATNSWKRAAIASW